MPGVLHSDPFRRPRLWRAPRRPTLLLAGALVVVACQPQTPPPVAPAPGAAPQRTRVDAPPIQTVKDREQPDAAAVQPSAGRELDAALSTYGYPFDVVEYRFAAQGLDLRMAYMDVAPEGGSKKAVVLLHGKNFSGAYWEQTARVLLDAGYRVVMPDQIGFGKSSKPTTYQYSFQALATHTRDLLASLGIEQSAIVGHSMGGMLATRFALMFPDACSALVLINPIGLEDWKRKVAYRSINQWLASELKKSPAKIKSYMQESYFAGEWKTQYEPLLAIQAGWAKGPDWPTLAEVSARTYDMIFTQPVVHEFVDLRVPTLLIIGQRDRTALGKPWAPPKVRDALGKYPELGRRAQSAIEDSKLVELDGVGHVPHFEAPQETHAALLSFLE